MKEKRLVMYMHAGSGNHGCEAIVNSTCHMIKEKPVLLSYYGGEDKRALQIISWHISVIICIGS